MYKIHEKMDYCSILNPLLYTVNCYDGLQNITKTMEENNDRQKHFKRAAVHPQRKTCEWGKAKQGKNAEKKAENVKRAAK